MKATLKFNIPEEEVDFNITFNAIKYYSVLHELDQWIRGVVKYDDCNPIRVESFQEVRNKLHELLQASEISID